MQNETQPVVPVETTVAPVAQQPAAPQPASVKPKNTKLRIIIASIVTVVLLGGGVAAYNLWYQNPDKVVHDGFANVLTHKGSLTADGTFTVGNDNMDGKYVLNAMRTEKNEATGTMSISMKIKEGGLKDQTIELQGAGVYAADGTVYFKVTNIKKTVSTIINKYVSDLADRYQKMGYNITEAQQQSARESMHKQIDASVAKLENQWIKVSASDMEDDDAKEYKCYTDAFKKLSTKENTNELTDVYKKNQFIVVGKKLGSKDGSLGYDVTIDKTKAKAFGEATKNTAVAKALDACEDKDGKKTTDSAAKTSDTTEVKTFQVWVSRWSHQLTKVIYEGVTTDESDGDKTTVKVDLGLKYGNAGGVDIPANAKTLDEVKESLESITSASGTV